MAGYVRQSQADIIPTATVRAAPLNAEYNAIRDAFAASGGHKHDGTSAEGEYVPLIADVDALNKVAIDTGNNRVGLFVEVAAATVEQLRIQDGLIVPVTDNDIDLGTTTLEFKNLYLDGTAKIDTLTVDENATVAGTLGVTGAATVGSTLGVTGVLTATGGVVGALTGAVTGNVEGILTGNVVGNVTGNVGGNVTSLGTSTFATVDINGGAIDGASIGVAEKSTGAFTTLASTELATLASVDINGGAIDGATIGASVAAAGSFTTISTTGQATLASADINGGAVDGAVIGAAVPAAVTGTLITANTRFVGPITGAVTGDVTGNVTGIVTGNVEGNLTGNVTAASGISTFNNVTVNGTLDVTGTTIANVVDPVNAQDAATKNYVDTTVAAVIDAAPAALDTLNELAAALGDDANFATTVTSSIATKLPLAGGTMSGAIAMGTSKITGMGDPVANQDAATKKYSDDQDALKLSLTGGTLTGTLAMGANKITSTYTPTDNADLTNKVYVDGILGSAEAAAASAGYALASQTAANTSKTLAEGAAAAALASKNAAADSYDEFQDIYLGAKSSAPTVDNDNDPLQTGALYYNTVSQTMFVYSGSAWGAAGSAINGTSERYVFTATSGQTNFSAIYDVGYCDVYLNGIKLAPADFTATDGATVILTTGATVNDIVDIVGYGTFSLADVYLKAISDAKYAQVLNNLSDLDNVGTARTNLGLGTAATTDSTAYATAAQGALADTATQPAAVVAKTSSTGSAVIPSGNTGQQDAVPLAGYLRFNTTDASFEGHNGTEWGSIGGGAVNGIFYENDQTIADSYTIGATRNAMSTGPLTLNSGVTVTVESGGRWVVL